MPTALRATGERRARRSARRRPPLPGGARPLPRRARRSHPGPGRGRPRLVPRRSCSPPPGSRGLVDAPRHPTDMASAPGVETSILPAPIRPADRERFFAHGWHVRELRYLGEESVRLHRRIAHAVVRQVPAPFRIGRAAAGDAPDDGIRAPRACRLKGQLSASTDLHDGHVCAGASTAHVHPRLRSPSGASLVSARLRHRRLRPKRDRLPGWKRGALHSGAIRSPG
jgi:hypothetical protein